MGGFAWVTLATNDSYSLGALVLAHSLRRSNTPHKLVVLITPAVSQLMREQLQTVFDLVKLVEVLDSKDEAHLALLKRPELGITFTKIHCWRLTDFDKCVFLDADTLVVRNCDELFERDELSAAPDFSWPDCFNSGVFVFKPSIETFNKIIQFAVEKGSFDGGDQGLLNQYFSDWSTEDIKKHLPFVYNLSSLAVYSYIPAFKQYGSETRIVHFIGTGKPWLQKLDPTTRTITPTSGAEHLTPLLQQWWDIFCEKVHPNLDKNLENSNEMSLPASAEVCFNSVAVEINVEPEKLSLDEPHGTYREKDDFRQFNLPYQSFDVKGSSGELLNIEFLMAPVPSPVEKGEEKEQWQSENVVEKSKERNECSVVEGNEKQVTRPQDENEKNQHTAKREKIDEEHQEERPPPLPKDPFDYNSFFPDEECVNDYLEQNVMVYQPFDSHHKNNGNEISNPRIDKESGHFNDNQVVEKRSCTGERQNVSSNTSTIVDNKPTCTCGIMSSGNNNSEPDKNTPSLPRFLTIPEDDKRQSGNNSYFNNNPNKAQQSNEEEIKSQHSINKTHESKLCVQEQKLEPQTLTSSENCQSVQEKTELKKSKSMTNLDVTKIGTTLKPSLWKSQPNVNVDLNKKFSMPKLKPILPKRNSHKTVPTSFSKITLYTEFLMSSDYQEPAGIPKDRIGFVEKHIVSEAFTKKCESERNLKEKFGPLPFLMEVQKPTSPKITPLKNIENHTELYDIRNCKRQLGNKPKQKESSAKKDSKISLGKPINVKKFALTKKKNKKALLLAENEKESRSLEKAKKSKEKKIGLKVPTPSVSSKAETKDNTNNVDEILKRLINFSKNYLHYFSEINTKSKWVPPDPFDRSPSIIHGNCESEERSGIAGAIAQLSLESSEPSSAASSALQEYVRRQNWETGNIDYMGRDSFDNIWAKICQTLEGKELEEIIRSPTTPDNIVFHENVEQQQAREQEQQQQLKLILDGVVQPTESKIKENIYSSTLNPDYIATLPSESSVGSAEEDDIIFSKSDKQQLLLNNVVEEEVTADSPGTILVLKTESENGSSTTPEVKELSLPSGSTIIEAKKIEEESSAIVAPTSSTVIISKEIVTSDISAPPENFITSLSSSDAPTPTLITEFKKEATTSLPSMAISTEGSGGSPIALTMVTDKEGISKPVVPSHQENINFSITNKPHEAAIPSALISLSTTNETPTADTITTAPLAVPKNEEKNITPTTFLVVDNEDSMKTLSTPPIICSKEEAKNVKLSNIFQPEMLEKLEGPSDSQKNTTETYEQTKEKEETKLQDKKLNVQDTTTVLRLVSETPEKTEKEILQMAQTPLFSTTDSSLGEEQKKTDTTIAAESTKEESKSAEDQDLTTKAIISDSLKENGKPKKKGVFTKILEIVGVAPKENESEISQSVFYDIESSESTIPVHTGKVESKETISNQKEIKPEFEKKDIETEKLISADILKDNKSKVMPESKSVDKLKASQLPEKEETKNSKLDENKESKVTESLTNETKSTQVETLNTTSILKSKESDVKVTDSSIVHVGSVKSKSPSPKLSISKKQEEVPEMAVTMSTPPAQTDLLKEIKNLALLTIDETILPTPPVPDQPKELCGSIKEESSEVSKGKVMSEIDEIIGKAKTEVESRLQAEELKNSEKQIENCGKEVTDLINTMKLIVDQKEERKEDKTQQLEKHKTADVSKLKKPEAGKKLTLEKPLSINPEEVEELKVTTPEEREKHKGEVASSKLSSQILKAIPPPRRKTISESKMEASSSTGAIPKITPSVEVPSEEKQVNIMPEKNVEGNKPSGEKPKKPSSIPVPPPRNKSKPTQPTPPKSKTKK